METQNRLNALFSHKIRELIFQHYQVNLNAQKPFTDQLEALLTDFQQRSLITHDMIKANLEGLPQTVHLSEGSEVPQLLGNQVIDAQMRESWNALPHVRRVRAFGRKQLRDHGVAMVDPTTEVTMYGLMETNRRLNRRLGELEHDNSLMSKATQNAVNELRSISTAFISNNQSLYHYVRDCCPECSTRFTNEYTWKEKEAMAKREPKQPKHKAWWRLKWEALQAKKAPVHKHHDPRVGVQDD